MGCSASTPDYSIQVTKADVKQALATSDQWDNRYGSHSHQLGHFVQLHNAGGQLFCPKPTKFMPEGLTQHRFAEVVNEVNEAILATRLGQSRYVPPEDVDRQQQVVVDAIRAVSKQIMVGSNHTVRISFNPRDSRRQPSKYVQQHSLVCDVMPAAMLMIIYHAEGSAQHQHVLSQLASASAQPPAYDAAVDVAASG